MAEGGVADLELFSDYSKSRFIVRKFWRDAMGGPRIELLEIKKKYLCGESEGWYEQYEREAESVQR